jgi:hypothetical protein
MRRVETEQCEGNADVVVEIAARRECRAGPLEDRGDHFLDRRLAVAAGDTDDRKLEVVAPGGGRGGQRVLRILHENLRQRPVYQRVDDGAGRAGRFRRVDEVVRVEARAAQRDEELAGREGARVGRDAGELPVSPDELAAAGARECCQAPLHAPLLPAVSRRAPSAARTVR